MTTLERPRPRPPGAGMGRKKGVPNKVTGAVREMVVEALNQLGGVDYLVEQAHKNPAAFLTLVGKVLPLQVSGVEGGPLVIRWETAPAEPRALAAVSQRLRA